MGRKPTSHAPAAAVPAVVRLALHAARAGTWELNLEDGSFRASDEALVLHGLEPGSNATHAEVLAAIHPDDRGLVTETIQSSGARGCPFRLEIRIPRPDGTERWLLSQAELQSGPGGRRLVGLVQDITERKLADEVSARLAALVASSQDAIMMINADGLISDWNAGAERLFGYSAAEAIGRTVHFLVPDIRAAEAERLLARNRQTETVAPFDTVRRHKDGTLVEVSLAISPITDARGRFIGTSAVLRDIGERRRAEEALRQADRRKDEFLATLAHELRNPLAPIRNAVEILRIRGSVDPDVTRARAVIDRQVHQMARLIDDLLDVSRISHGKIELRRERIPLEQIVQAAVETSRPLIEQKHHQLSVTLPPEPVILDGDPTRLAQILSNLLTNAAKYTRRSGIIRLGAEVVGAQVRISVSDSGIGIAGEKLASLFVMFSQTQSALEHSDGGLGIGLHLARGLAELHGGTIEAASDGPGQRQQLHAHPSDRRRRGTHVPGGSRPGCHQPNAPSDTGHRR
jgi:PAS domain S-box-containing protein